MPKYRVFLTLAKQYDATFDVVADCEENAFDLAAEVASSEHYDRKFILDYEIQEVYDIEVEDYDIMEIKEDTKAQA